MPCRSYTPEEELYSAQTKVDKLTRMLCEAMGKLIPIAERGNEILVLSPELESWWKKHQKEDKKRLEEEKKEKLALRKRREGWKKLSPTERKSLGLPAEIKKLK